MGKLIDVKDWEKADKLILLRGWKRNGLTNKQIAENIGISERTFYLWMKKSKVISQTMLFGKQHAKFIVENALFEKARTGNTTAMIFWLKNNWRDKYSDTIKTPEELAQIKEQIEILKIDRARKQKELDLLQQNSGNIEINIVPFDGGKNEQD